MIYSLITQKKKHPDIRGMKAKIYPGDTTGLKRIFLMTGAFLFLLIVLCPVRTVIGQDRSQKWTTFAIAMLPDTSFAVIEFGEDGNKIRHCPYLTANGKIDAEQLIYVMGTFSEEEWINFENRKIAHRILQKHYAKYLKRGSQKESPKQININRAKLTELITLPHVGPALAVKIVDYRKKHQGFDTIEEIKKVNGIGQGVFNAILHYITLF